MSLGIALGVVGCLVLGFMLDDRSRTPDLPAKPPKPKRARWWNIPVWQLPRHLRERRKPPKI